MQWSCWQTLDETEKGGEKARLRDTTAWCGWIVCAVRGGTGDCCDELDGMVKVERKTSCFRRGTRTALGRNLIAERDGRVTVGRGVQGN